MDGRADPRRPAIAYGRHDIPAYRAFAQQYSLCENYFTDVARKSEPNHLHVIAAYPPIINNSTMARRCQPMPLFHLPNLHAHSKLPGTRGEGPQRIAAPTLAHYAQNAQALWGDTTNV